MSGTVSVHLIEDGETRLIIKKTNSRKFRNYEIKDKDGVEIYTVCKSPNEYSRVNIPDDWNTNEAQLKLMKIREQSWPSIRSKLVYYSTLEGPSGSKELHLQMTYLFCSGPRWELRSGDGELIVRNDADSPRDKGCCVVPWRQGRLINSKIFAKDGETQIGRFFVDKRTSGLCRSTRDYVCLEVQQDLPVNQDALLAAYFCLDLELDWWRRTMDLFWSIISIFILLCCFVINWQLEVLLPSSYWIALVAGTGMWFLILVIYFFIHNLYLPRGKIDENLE